MKPYTRLPNHTAFLSASLHYEDRPVVDFFRGLLFEYGIRPITIGIDVYAANNYEAAIVAEQEIKRADCVVAILTKRYLLERGGYKPFEWTFEEPAIGVSASKPLYVFYEDGISLKGISATRARVGIPFDRAKLKDDRSRLAEHVHKIQDEIATIKSNGFWKVVGVGAVIVGGLYLLGRFFGSGHSDDGER